MATFEPFYVYKIFSSTFHLRQPLPERVPVDDVDQTSGFIHLLTAEQVPHVLKSMFKNDPVVYVLRILYRNLSQDIRWENADRTASEALPKEELCPVSIVHNPFVH